MNLQAKWINLLKPRYIKDEAIRKKIQIIIFFSITFGLTFLLGLLLCFREYIDPESFAGFMMILPLSSVSIAKFYTEGRNNEKHKFYSGMIFLFILSTLLFTLSSLKVINAEQFEWINYLLVLISGLIIIIYSTNLSDFYIFKNIKIGALLIGYFMLTKIIPIVFFSIIEGEKISYDGIFNYVFFLPIMSFASMYYFIGEEYGWRGFLQDILFDRFGKRLGVIMLGVCWSLWHLPLQFTLYSPKTPILGTVNHLIFVIGLSIFLGYVYMKTKNVWFCAIIHALNNGAGVILSDYSYESVITFSTIVQILILVSILYVPFIFTKEYKKDL
ncbi:CPBP family intramembrane glutamic endopeptidase [Metaclostridioides mangenotii]|uniref:CPBP family intramembrane glutamic endopeptidase n=1 Tax=Metaclostridioides mangenotii TaxID=1540 RepID=UPI0026EC0E84|nr:type II CAAX endopeptidase family protein [Clostridioides mangenotii]